MIFDLQEAPADLERVADVCVIGAGFAGLLAARALARRGFQVVVLESGGFAPDRDGDRLNVVETAGAFSKAVSGRARGLGGTSSRWTGRILPLTEEELGARPALNLEAWPISKTELDPYLPEIEALFGVDRQAYDLEPTGEQRWLQAEDFVSRWPKLPPIRRCNLAKIMGAELRRTPNLEVWLHATVVRQELDAEQATLRALHATSASGRGLIVRAREFFYAAGTIENTRLLLTLNRESGGRAFENCDALGAYFQDHLDAEVGKIEPLDIAATHRLFTYHFCGRGRRSLHLNLTAAAQAEERVAASYASVLVDFGGQSEFQALREAARALQRGGGFASVAAFASIPKLLTRVGAWRLFAGRLYLPPDISLRLHVCAEQTPDPTNKISLGEELDEFGIPRARIKWEPKAADEHTFTATVRRLHRFWRQSGLLEVCDVRWAAEHREGPTIRHAADFAHPSGSTRMGLDPRTSVVGPDLRCWHVGNLSVLGASVFPHAGASNPTCTVMQLAMRAAAALRL